MALMCAAEGGHVAAIEALIEHGADKDMQNKVRSMASQSVP